MITASRVSIRSLALMSSLSFAASVVFGQSPEGHGPAHHPAADQPLMAFHELMEPLWHAPPAPQVNARACAIADEVVLRARAAAVRPTHDNGALLGAARSLQQACAAHHEAQVGADLGRLHELFHKLAGAAG